MTFKIFAKKHNKTNEDKEILLISFNTKKHQNLEDLYSEGVGIINKRKIKGYVSKIVFGQSEYEYDEADKTTYFTEYLPSLIA